ncbi:hypothetical protein OESDEN_02724 [Oesophagostomum dentatum]|uniref:Uncharacterized protein n=1 Tax=Oesophagostomum dentatum TaxID=61180 RepID=A0A0B1TN93_OESDE|nr:hypothetical protein OESDEN_02724 [Oesophagostomum dentatum]
MDAIAESHATESYCEKFADQYKQLCREGSKLAKTDEFCTSYTASCKREVSLPVSRAAVKEIENIEDFPEETTGGGATAAPEDEENETTRPPRITRYCEKFWENFNYFCAGESSSENEKFCRSYRNNCPQKVGS